MTKAGSGMFATALDELGAVLARMDEARIDAACAMLAGAGRILGGLGRHSYRVSCARAWNFALQELRNIVSV